MFEQYQEDDHLAASPKEWQNWFGGQMGKYVVLFLVFVFTLTLFLQFREVSMDTLEVGTLSPRYVIAQTDFNFPDEEGTQILRQEALKDIGAIYELPDMQVSRMRHELENTLINQQKWRDDLPKSTFEELDHALDVFEEVLVAERFTDERTLQRIERLNWPTDNFYILKLSQAQLINYAFPSRFWSQLEKKILIKDAKLSKEIVSYLLKNFSDSHWNLEQDSSLERTVRQLIQSQIPIKYSPVEEGTEIVRRGEKVNHRHIVLINSMKSALAKSQYRWTLPSFVENLLIALILSSLLLFYLRFFQRNVFKSFRKMALLTTIVIISLALAKAIEYFLLYQTTHFNVVRGLPLFLPFMALLLTVLLGSQIAFATSILVLLLAEIALAFDTQAFLLVNFFSMVTTLLFARNLHKRREVFSVLGKVWLTCIPLIMVMHITDQRFWSILLLSDIITSFSFTCIISLIVIGLLPACEVLFQVMTNMALMDYLDPNNELLRRLSLEAPGTYQHCLVVGNLSDSAASAIGANGLFCRVATLYHDIGKLFNPHYFTENQLSGFNIHQLLTPMESTHVIMAHVAEGEALARKYHIPQSFIDVIREHHGTTMVYYFYCKQVEQMGGDPTKVNEKIFRYPGPKPHSKESAIIMIADTVEAASRSMAEVNEETLTDLVDKLVSKKAEDGQFDECQLTFEELGQVKRSIVKALLVIRHLRVSFPEKK